MVTVGLLNTLKYIWNMIDIRRYHVAAVSGMILDSIMETVVLLNTLKYVYIYMIYMD